MLGFRFDILEGLTFQLRDSRLPNHGILKNFSIPFTVLTSHILPIQSSSLHFPFDYPNEFFSS